MGSPSIIGGALQGHLCARLLVIHSMQLEASCASLLRCVIKPNIINELLDNYRYRLFNPKVIKPV